MQDFKDLITNFIRAWNFTRSETFELLDSLSDEDLLFKPDGDKWQALYYQFGCIGRTQLVYTRAIVITKMDFGYFNSPTLPRKDDFKTQTELLKFLADSQGKWIKAISKVRNNPDFFISWPGHNQSLPEHISSLMAHERLHHGQLISYFTLANLQLPRGFKSNWAL